MFKQFTRITTDCNFKSYTHLVFFINEDSNNCHTITMHLINEAIEQQQHIKIVREDRSEHSSIAETLYVISEYYQTVEIINYNEDCIIAAVDIEYHLI